MTMMMMMTIIVAIIMTICIMNLRCRLLDPDEGGLCK